MQIEFAGSADLDAMAGLLGELFTLESDFTPDRAKQLAALRWILEDAILAASHRGGGHGRHLVEHVLHLGCRRGRDRSAP
ncbi:MAG: hypothetical protein Q8O52_14840 [Sulfuritalea sp.]|nr:hypothetical protein [Sulfuritalea sp.]